MAYIDHAFSISDEDVMMDTPFSLHRCRPTKEIALAISLLVFGALAILGGALMAYNRVGGDLTHGISFTVLGAVLFIPSFYYTRIAYYAYKGYRGFSFANILAVEIVFHRILDVWSYAGIVDVDVGGSQNKSGLKRLPYTDFMNHGKAETKYPKGFGNSYPLPFFMKQDDLGDDELEELIKERYGRDSKHVVYDQELKECEVAVTKGPPIWRVKCKIGRERYIVFCLMQKFVDLQEFGTKLEILSVFSIEHVNGFVYFEADKACDVTEMWPLSLVDTISWQFVVCFSFCSYLTAFKPFAWW